MSPSWWRLISVLLPVVHAAEWPPRPQLTQLQRNSLQGVSAALLTRSVVSQARRAASRPPLRLELGQEEEASLVDNKPPGPWQLFTRAIVLLFNAAGRVPRAAVRMPLRAALAGA